MNHKLKSKSLLRNINNLSYADDSTLTTESRDELKNLLMRVKRRVKELPCNSTLKKTNGTWSSWKIEREKVEAVTDFIFLGSKITVDDDCIHETKRHLLLGRKAMTNLDSVIKSRDITLLTKVYLVKAIIFPVVIYGCESWTIKKAEC